MSDEWGWSDYALYGLCAIAVLLLIAAAVVVPVLAAVAR